MFKLDCPDLDFDLDQPFFNNNLDSSKIDLLNSFSNNKTQIDNLDKSQSSKIKLNNPRHLTPDLNSQASKVISCDLFSRDNTFQTPRRQDASHLTHPLKRHSNTDAAFESVSAFNSPCSNITNTPNLNKNTAANLKYNNEFSPIFQDDFTNDNSSFYETKSTSKNSFNKNFGSNPNTPNTSNFHHHTLNPPNYHSNNNNTPNHPYNNNNTPNHRPYNNNTPNYNSNNNTPNHHPFNHNTSNYSLNNTPNLLFNNDYPLKRKHIDTQSDHISSSISISEFEKTFS